MIPAGLPARFTLLDEEAAGGHGAVVAAFDQSLRRLVALKRPYLESSQTTREIEILRTLDHPRISKLLDVQVCPPELPLLVFDYHANITLHDWLVEHRERRAQVPVDAIIELFAKIAEAVGYLHARGVLHRDLSPSNILLKLPESSADVSLNNGGEEFSLCRFEPIVTDFGLAVRVGTTEESAIHPQVIGTPGFMAPEMIAPRSQLIGPQADVFALGILLYETLTGRHPFRTEIEHQTIQRIQAAHPDSPRKLQPALPKDVATIVLHCLHKDPRRRYPSAVELAADLRAFLAGQRPLLAKPIGVVEHALRLVRQHPAMATMAVACAIIAFVTAGWIVHLRSVNADLATALSEAEREFQRAEHGKRLAQLEATRARTAEERNAEQAYARNMDAAQRKLEQGDTRSAVAHLLACEPARRCFVWRHLHFRAHDYHIQLRPHHGAVRHVAYSTNGKYFATCGDDGIFGNVAVWDWRSGDKIREFRLPGAPVGRVTFSPSDDDIVIFGADNGVLGVCRVSTGKNIATWKGHQGPVSGLALTINPDTRAHSSILWTCGADGTVRRWHVATGEAYRGVLLQQTTPFVLLQVSTKASVVKALDQAGVTHFWDGGAAAPARQFASAPRPGEYTAFAMIPEQLEPHVGDFFKLVARSVVLGDTEGYVVHRWSDGEASRWQAHRGQRISAIAWLPDGGLITGGGDGNLLRWKDTRGSDRQLCTYHAAEVTCLSVSPQGGTISGSWLVSGDKLGYIKVSDLNRLPSIRFITQPPPQWQTWAAATSDRRCQAIPTDQGVRILDASGEERLLLDTKRKALNAAFSPDETALVAEVERAGGGSEYITWLTAAAPR